jgi:lipopolysaccharide export system ATP-binding protein
MTSQLRAESLTKIYGHRKVVDEVSLEVSPGEIVGLLGPNGAGKTTTFRMIVGLIRPNSGRVYLNGKQVTRTPMHKRARLGLGYLPQEPSVFRGLTVEENVLAILETQRIRRKDQKVLLANLLESLQIEHLAEYRADTLSGGERRRLEISRLLAVEPSFILLDEPFTGIDPKAVAEIQTVIRNLRDRLNLGILVTDHQVRETLEVTDRSYIIDSGKVLTAGEPGELIEDPEVRRIYLGEGFYMRHPEHTAKDREAKSKTVDPEPASEVRDEENRREESPDPPTPLVEGGGPRRD